MDWELGDAWSLGSKFASPTQPAHPPVALYLCYSPYHPFDNSDEDAQGDHELDQRFENSISQSQSKSMAEVRKFLTERRDTMERILIGRVSLFRAVSKLMSVLLGSSRALGSDEFRR